MHALVSRRDAVSTRAEARRWGWRFNFQPSVQQQNFAKDFAPYAEALRRPHTGRSPLISPAAFSMARKESAPLPQRRSSFAGRLRGNKSTAA